MARRRPQVEDPEINITPMLDIVFIMLIFFIVTTSFTRETGVLIDRPVADQAVTLTNGTLLIGIRPDNEIWIARRKIELREVRPAVERIMSENPEGSVVIVADRGSSIGTVTHIMDQVKLAGVESVALSASQPGSR